jgi:hypothetical protein
LVPGRLASIANVCDKPVRDVTLCEDASRIRKNPGVFARIRSFAYNILRINQTDSIAQDRYAAALGGLDFLLSLKFYRER